MAAPTLKTACTASIVVRPAATHRPRTEGGDHHHHPEEPELLPYEREDHVRPELRHDGTLGARSGTDPKNPARLYGDHRLDHLVARAIRDGPGIQERHDPLAPVGGEPHDPEEDDEGRHRGEHEVPCPELRGPEHPGRARQEHDGGAEVRLHEHEREEHPHGRQGPQRQPRTRGDARHRAAQHQDGCELRELPGLQAQRPEVQPSASPAHLRADTRDQDQYQTDEHSEVQSRCVPAPSGVPHLARQKEGQDPERHVSAAQQQVVRPELPVGRRVHHDEPQKREAQGDEEQVRAQACQRRAPSLLPASSATRRANSSPRSAYPANWSKLAQPGESKITSPSLASKAASATASLRSETSRQASPQPVARRYSKMPGPASPWQTIARQRPRCGNISEKSASFSEPPRISTTGPSKLVSAAPTAAGLVALESSTYSTPARSATTSMRCGLSR